MMSLSITAIPTAFDRWLDSPMSGDIALYPTRLLLDIPPAEVRARIAYFVSAGSQTDQLLALARTNHVQRSAVVDALHHSFVLSAALLPQVLARWVDVFLRDIRELVCERLCLRNVPTALHPHPVSLWQSSSLRKVVLFDEYDVFEVMQNHRSIQEVVVHLNDPAQALALLKTLSTLSLASLEIICTPFFHVRQTCCFESLSDLSDKEKTIAGVCPSLKALRLRCKKHRTCKLNDVLWRCVRELPTLEEVTVPGSVPNALLHLLDGVREIRVHDFHKVTYRTNLLRTFASRITAIRTEQYFSESDSESLAGCVMLKELDTMLESGSEQALGHALRGMEDLRHLTLRWKQPSREGHRVIEDKPHYPEAKDVVPLIGNVPKVEKMRLRKVRIYMWDIASILRKVGKGLKEFDVELMSQKEVPLKRLAPLLGLVTMYCPRLQRLTFGSSKVLLIDSPQNFNISGGWAGVKAQLLEVEQALSVLKRHLPMLDVRDVEDLVTTVKQNFVMLSSLGLY